MSFTQLDVIEPREILPGFWARMVHSDRLTVAFWEIEAGARLPAHSHPQEQVTAVLAGELEMTVGGATRVLGPGAVAVIPGQVEHSGRALSPCRVVDAFSPPRDDYRRPE